MFDKNKTGQEKNDEDQDLGTGISGDQGTAGGESKQEGEDATTDDSTATVTDLEEDETVTTE